MGSCDTTAPATEVFLNFVSGDPGWLPTSLWRCRATTRRPFIAIPRSCSRPTFAPRAPMRSSRPRWTSRPPLSCAGTPVTARTAATSAIRAGTVALTSLWIIGPSHILNSTLLESTPVRPAPFNTVLWDRWAAHLAVRRPVSVPNARPTVQHSLHLTWPLSKSAGIHERTRMQRFYSASAARSSEVFLNFH